MEVSDLPTVKLLLDKQMKLPTEHELSFEDREHTHPETGPTGPNKNVEHLTRDLGERNITQEEGSFGKADQNADGHDKINADKPSTDQTCEEDVTGNKETANTLTQNRTWKDKIFLCLTVILVILLEVIEVFALVLVFVSGSSVAFLKNILSPRREPSEHEDAAVHFAEDKVPALVEMKHCDTSNHETSKRENASERETENPAALKLDEDTGSFSGEMSACTRRPLVSADTCAINSRHGAGCTGKTEYVTEHDAKAKVCSGCGGKPHNVTLPPSCKTETRSQNTLFSADLNCADGGGSVTSETNVSPQSFINGKNEHLYSDNAIENGIQKSVVSGSCSVEGTGQPGGCDGGEVVHMPNSHFSENLSNKNIKCAHLTGRGSAFHGSDSQTSPLTVYVQTGQKHTEESRDRHVVPAATVKTERRDNHLHVEDTNISPVERLGPCHKDHSSCSSTATKCPEVCNQNVSAEFFVEDQLCDSLSDHDRKSPSDEECSTLAQACGAQFWSQYTRVEERDTTDQTMVLEAGGETVLARSGNSLYSGTKDAGNTAPNSRATSVKITKVDAEANHGPQVENRFEVLGIGAKPKLQKTDPQHDLTCASGEFECSKTSASPPCAKRRLQDGRLKYHKNIPPSVRKVDFARSMPVSGRSDYEISKRPKNRQRVQHGSETHCRKIRVQNKDVSKHNVCNLFAAQKAQSAEVWRYQPAVSAPQIYQQHLLVEPFVQRERLDSTGMNASRVPEPRIERSRRVSFCSGTNWQMESRDRRSRRTPTTTDRRWPTELSERERECFLGVDTSQHAEFITENNHDHQNSPCLDTGQPEDSVSNARQQRFFSGNPLQSTDFPSGRNRHELLGVPKRQPVESRTQLNVVAFSDLDTNRLAETSTETYYPSCFATGSNQCDSFNAEANQLDSFAAGLNHLFSFTPESDHLDSFSAGHNRFDITSARTTDQLDSFRGRSNKPDSFSAALTNRCTRTHQHSSSASNPPLNQQGIFRTDPDQACHWQEHDAQPGGRYTQFRAQANAEILVQVQELALALAQAQAQAQALALALVQAQPLEQAQAPPQTQPPAKAQENAEAQAQPPPPARTSPSEQAQVNTGQAEVQTQPQAEVQPQWEVQARARGEVQTQLQGEVQAQVEIQPQPQAREQVEVQRQAQARTRAEVQAQLQAEVQPQAEVEAQPRAEVLAQADIPPQAQALVQAQPHARAEAQAQLQAEVRAQADVTQSGEFNEDEDHQIANTVHLRQPGAGGSLCVLEPLVDRLVHQIHTGNGQSAVDLTGGGVTAREAADYPLQRGLGRQIIQADRLRILENRQGQMRYVNHDTRAGQVWNFVVDVYRARSGRHSPRRAPCVQCPHRHADTMLLNCQHRVCLTCARFLDDCPYPDCGAPIVSFIRIY